MDFHSLSRKDLQTLCKKNKIPANLSNVAMADALTSLHKVEGVDEFMNALESDTQKSPERLAPECPDIPKTASRTTTRRKQVEVEPPSTRRTTRRSTVVEADQEIKNANQLVTPAVPPTRTRRMATAAASVRQRSVAGVEKSEQRGAGTRQSVRLLEKSLREMTLMAKEKVEPVKIDDYGSGKVSEEIVNKIGILEDHLSQNQTVDNENFEDKVPEDNKGNEYEKKYCSVKLDFDGDDDSSSSGSHVKGEVDDENIATLNGNTEKSINDNEEDPSTGENNDEILNDSLISEIVYDVNSNDSAASAMEVRNTESPTSQDEEYSSPNEIQEPLVRGLMFAEEDPSIGENNDEMLNDSLISENVYDVNSNNDRAASAMEVKNTEIANSQDEEFSSPNEIQEPLVRGHIGDDSENNSMQDEQHDNLDVGSKFSIKKVVENETRGIVQGQISHPSESVSGENLESRNENEGCHQVSNNLESFSDCDAFKRLNESCDKAESEVTQVVKTEDWEETKVLENDISETSVNLQEMPEEKMVVTSKFECPSTLNNPTNKVTGAIVSSPLAFDTLQAQFPRPTASTPMRCPTQKDTALPTVNQLSDSDEDNIHNSGNNLEPKKEEVRIMTDEGYENCSLRQLTKMVKKLQISKKNKEEKNANKAAKTTRPALQVVQENCIPTTESGKEF